MKDVNNYWYQYLGVSNLSELEEITLCENKYIVKNGILRLLKQYTENQEQTKESFGFKWKKRDTYESESVMSSGRKWLVDRYLSGDEEKLFELIPEGAKVLDAGCGSGYSALLLFGDYINHLKYLGVDISSAVDVAKERFIQRNIHAEFLQADLLNLPFNQPIFDAVFSEGVLHHTDSTESSFKGLSKLLLPNGVLFAYIYRKKSSLREYSDDYIREYLSTKSDSEAWDALLPLSQFGKYLGDQNITIDVPEAIPFLGIPKGEIGLQRLFYWYIFKAYHKPGWSIDELNHINFDWYRPPNCHRHTVEEINGWCKKYNLHVERLDVQNSGITVIARKMSS